MILHKINKNNYKKEILFIPIIMSKRSIIDLTKQEPNKSRKWQEEDTRVVGKDMERVIDLLEGIQESIEYLQDMLLPGWQEEDTENDES